MDPQTLQSSEFVFDPKLSSNGKVVYRCHGGNLEGQLNSQQQQELAASSTKSNTSLLSSGGYRFYLEGIYEPTTIDQLEYGEDYEYEKEHNDDNDDVVEAERFNKEDDILLMTPLGCCGGNGSSRRKRRNNQGETAFIHLSSVENGTDGSTAKRVIDNTIIHNYQWSIYRERNDNIIVDDDGNERKKDICNEGDRRKWKVGGNSRMLLARSSTLSSRRRRSHASSLHSFMTKKDITQHQRTSDPYTYTEKKSAAATAAAPWRIRLSILSNSRCDVQQADILEVKVQQKQKNKGGKKLQKNGFWNIFFSSSNDVASR